MMFLKTEQPIKGLFQNFDLQSSLMNWNYLYLCGNFKS